MFKTLKKCSILLLALTIFLMFPIATSFAHEGEGIASENPNLLGHEYDQANHPIEETTLTIIHDTHLHGNFGDANKEENIANYFGVINQIREEKPNSIVIGNGDDLATSLLSSTFAGQHIVDAFNAGKLDVDTFGNHDFDMGPDQLTKLIERSNFTWVSANVIDKRTNDVFGKEQGARRFIIKEVNGVKVGITGLINEEAPEITTMGDNAKVLNPVEAMKSIIPEMKKAGADLIVVSSHLASPDARIVAEQVDGIDLIVGDHAAKVNDTLEKINNTLLSFIGDEFAYLGEINLYIRDGKIEDFNFKRYSLKEEAVKEGFTPDAAVKAVMDKYNKQLDTQLDIVIGRTEAELDVMKETQRKEETKIGNFIADTMKEYTKADAALINGGGIRAGRIFPAGSLTKRDIMDALPFTNFIVKIEVTGEQIQQALENSVSEIDKGAGRFAQVSGIKYSYNPQLPVGSRVIDIEINGKKLDKNATYTLATADFVAKGGDGYEAFKNAKVLLDANSGPLLSTLIIDAIQQKGTINPKIEGRITVTTKQKQEQNDNDKQIEKTKTKADLVYIVKKGDTLYHIGKKHGIDWKILAKYNHLTNPNLILIGQKILIPQK
ncbi:MAG: 5'-nucleotidase C-terminal domain-containing protein [Tepidibacillus sp.]